jgi:AcrR family transcriptional regulator
MMNQRARQRETTRRDLVDAGLRLVASNGFAATTTASIAQATGKAHGTVFVHFRTREALVAELIAEVGRVMSAQLAPLEDCAPTLAQVMQAHLAALAENEALYSRLLSEACTLPLAARAHIFALQSGIAARLRKAYARAKMQGKVREMDPVMLGNMWISLTNHYLLNRDLFAPGQGVMAKCGANIQAQLLDLIQITKDQP